DPFESDTLVLKEASGTSKTVFHFDSNEEKMTVQKFSVDDYGNFQPADGFLQPLALHSDTVKVELAEFRIVPSADPYDAANIISGDKLFWYQPIVQFKLMTYAQGRVREKIELEFQTSVTSRKYQ
ncbi:hypothetical protein KKC94_03425, partial [Patescibacteria group bacterium]|nr:hypothetical protein [Patescibacteria group bacterium]